MPLVTAIPRGQQNGDIVTEFKDTTSTTSIIYTYPVTQSTLIIENSGEHDIFVTIGDITDQLIQVDKKWKYDGSFTSFSIRSIIDSQEFIVTAIEESVAPDLIGIQSQVDGLTTQLAHKANQADLLVQKTRIDNLPLNSPSATFGFKQNILPINYTSGGYWNKDVNNNLNLVANTSYNCITSINVKAGITYTTGIVMGYYSWLKSTADGSLTRLDNTSGVQETTYTFTPSVDSTLWLSASNGKLPFVMVIQNGLALPTVYKKPNVIYDIYVEDRLIDNIDKISGITNDVVSGAISTNIQNANMTTGYYWKFVSPNMTQVSYASYNILDPIELKAGVPYSIGKVFGRWSWVYDKVTHTANYLDSVDEYLNYTITPANDSLLYLTCNSAIPQVFKNAYDMPNDTFTVGVPINNQIDGYNKRFVVGAGLQYTSLTQAIADAVKYPHSIVEVKGGTYDLYQEQGGDSYFNTFTYSDASPTFCGIVLKNDVHVIFSSDSQVVFNYTGSNAAVMQYYSPFNAAQGLSGFTLENLNLQCSNCRYGVHDERGYTLGRYKNSYINCEIILDNSHNTAWNNYQCIGGGLGISGYIEIDGCQFTSVISSPVNIVSYHNDGDTAATKSKIVIKNSWFCDNGYARIGYYGTTTQISEMIVTGCSYNHVPTLSAEGSATIVNVKLTTYANELRA